MIADVLTTAIAEEISLKEVYKDDFDIGAAVSPETMVSFDALIQRHFSGMTPEKYQALFELFSEKADVIEGVSTWGVADDHTWLDFFPVRGRKNWPLLFDTTHSFKPAFYVAAAVKSE